MPATFLIAELGGVVVGRTSIRHSLNDWLLAYGGHIGYVVLPKFRRCGLVTEMLRLSAIVARALGVGRILLTCDEHNIGSIRVIERCGGFLEEQRPAEPDLDDATEPMPRGEVDGTVVTWRSASPRTPGRFRGAR